MDIAQNHTVARRIADFSIQGFDLDALHDGIWDCIMASFEYGSKLLISISRTILKVSIPKGTLRDYCFCHDGKMFPEDVINYVEAGRWFCFEKMVWRREVVFGWSKWVDALKRVDALY